MPIAGLVVVLVLVAVLMWVVRPTNSSSEATPAAEISMNTDPEPVPSPPIEWEADPAWSTPPLMQDTGQVPVIGGDKVALITADRDVVLVNAAGDPLWSAPLPGGELTPNRVLTPTRIDGRTVVALHMGERLVWWDVGTGEPGQVEVPADPAVTYFGDGPLIAATQATVALIAEGQLQEVEVPEGATAFAARSDGVVVAASSQGRWSLQPGAGSPVQAWQDVAQNHAIIPIAWSWDRLIAIQKPTRQVEGAPTIVDGATKLVIYGPEATTPEWSADVDLPLGQVTWRPAPSGRWGMLNDILVDLQTRQVQQVPGWTTTAVASDRALGTINNQRVLVGPSIPPGVLAPDEGFPEDTIRMDESRVGALVRTQSDAAQTVSVLPPKGRS